MVLGQHGFGNGLVMGCPSFPIAWRGRSKSLLALWVMVLGLLTGSPRTLVAADPITASSNRLSQAAEAEYWGAAQNAIRRDRALESQRRASTKAQVQGTLEAVAKRAVDDHHAGRTEKLDLPSQTRASSFAKPEEQGSQGLYLVVFLLVGFLLLNRIFPHWSDEVLHWIDKRSESSSLLIRVLFAVPSAVFAGPLADALAILARRVEGSPGQASRSTAQTRGSDKPGLASSASGDGTGDAIGAENPAGESASHEDRAASLSHSASNLPPLPEELAEIRQLLPELTRDTNEEARLAALKGLHDLVHSLVSQTRAGRRRPALQLGSGLAALLKGLVEKPGDATPSAVRTIGNAVDLLTDLCAPGVRPDLATYPPVQILAVDDDPIARRAMTFLLQKAFERPDVAESGDAALPLVQRKPYDVIFLDVQMPGLDGFGLCGKIRETIMNRETPVVFVTAFADFNSRAQSTLCGGNELIAKPYSVRELTVKALTFVLRGRLEKQRTLEKKYGEMVRPASLASREKNAGSIPVEPKAETPEKTVPAATVGNAEPVVG